MNLPIVFRFEASREVEQTCGYLDNENPGFGQEFLERLKETTSRISERPKAYAVIARGCRAARLHQFPYVVYFQIRTSHVEVLAVVHGSREPRTWQSRT